MNDYQKADRGWCGDPRRGAAMGRSSDLPKDALGPLTIRKVPLDSGGYDPGGTYWGMPVNTSGSDLYCVSDEDGRVSYLRASSFDVAKARFPQATWAIAKIDESDIDDMLTAYIEAALWSSNDESTEDGGEPFDANYCEADLDPATRDAMRDECARFVQYNVWTFTFIATVTDIDWTQVGHDLWLSSNGHGVGFRDRKCYAGREKDLDDACGWGTPFGETNLYLGDDKKIHAQ